MSGRFITLEGGEGAGKTTQIRLLAESLRARGAEVVTTREPGGAPGAEQIRTLLVEGEPGRWDAWSEALLHTAARRDHLRATVWPALEEGHWVLCDRFYDSTVAYQGYGHRLGVEAIEQLQTLVLGSFCPDLTIVLDLPVDSGLARAIGRGGAENRYERMDVGFHQRLRLGYLDIARRHDNRCVVIDAAQAAEAVHEQIMSIVDRLE